MRFVFNGYRSNAPLEGQSGEDDRAKQKNNLVMFRSCYCFSKPGDLGICSAVFYHTPLPTVPLLESEAQFRVFATLDGKKCASA